MTDSWSDYTPLLSSSSTNNMEGVSGLLFNTAEVDSTYKMKQQHMQMQMMSRGNTGDPSIPPPMHPVMPMMTSLFSPHNQSNPHLHLIDSTDLTSSSSNDFLNADMIHGNTEGSSPHSRSSSPFSSSHTSSSSSSSSHPLDSPVHTQELSSSSSSSLSQQHSQQQWIDPIDLLVANTTEGESEGESGSLHSGSAHHSGVSTPFSHLQPPHQQQTPQMLATPPPNLVMHQMQMIQQGGMMLMPTINEHLLARPQAMKPSMSNPALFAIDTDELLPELHLPAPQMMPMQHIGMLQPMQAASNAMMLDNPTPNEPTSVSSTPSSTSERIHVRAKRRTRYTTAAAASVAARTSLTVTSPQSFSCPTTQPKNQRENSYMSGSASGQSSEGEANDEEKNAEENENNEGEGGEQQNEEEAEQEENGEEDDDSYSGASTGTNNKKTKRKRGSKAAAASSSSTQGSFSPQLKGLDKRERNKLSASMYRKRRKVYLDSLEGKVGELDETISKQTDTISKMAAENKALKEQLSFFKRMVAQINPSAAAASSSSSSAAAANEQPSNVHYGARGGRGQLASFMMVVISCILLVTGGGFFINELSSSSVVDSQQPTTGPSSTVYSGMPEIGSGPRRKLLNVEESTLDYAHVDPLPIAEIAIPAFEDIKIEAVLSTQDHTLEEAMKLLNINATANAHAQPEIVVAR